MPQQAETIVTAHDPNKPNVSLTSDDIDFDSTASEFGIDDALSAVGVTERHKGESNTNDAVVDPASAKGNMPAHERTAARKAAASAKASTDTPTEDVPTDDAAETTDSRLSRVGMEQTETAQRSKDAARGDERSESTATGSAEQYPLRRNYEQFPQEQRAHLKKMSNAQFAYVEKLYQDHAKASSELTDLKKAVGDSGIPLNWYSHKEAYTLHPQYQERAIALNENTIAAQHWQAQLESIEEGGKWRPLVRDEQGNLALGAEQEGTARSKAQIISALQKCNTRIERAQGEMDLMRNSFGERYTRAAAFLENTTKAELEKVPEALRPQKQVVDNIMKHLPPELDGAAATTIASLYALCVNMHGALQHAMQKRDTVQQLQKDQEKAGGRTSRVKAPRQGAVADDDDENVIDFDKTMKMFARE